MHQNLIDYHLSDGETGLSVIAAMHEKAGQGLKTLLITGNTSSVIRKILQGLNLPIIRKPVNADKMLNLLEVLLGA